MLHNLLILAQCRVPFVSTERYSTMVDPRASAPSELNELVQQFTSQPGHLEPSYKEDWARTEFIEPMLHILGWPHLRHAELTTESTGFLREVPIDADSVATVPDYALYVDGRRVAYIEAKKPAVNIHGDAKPAFQIREYGWNAGDPVGFLTDFEEFAAYDTRLEPLEGAEAEVGRLAYFRCEQYKDNWSWFCTTLTPEAIRAGALDELIGAAAKAKRLRAVDKALLREIERWRLQLAEAITRSNNGLSPRNLNTVVQALIDRVLFLRIAEARGLEAPGQLASTLAAAGGIYPSLVSLFQAADLRYNSGLFHFADEAGQESPDEISLTLTIPDDALRPLIERLTTESSPYRFSVMPVDILGQMYEQMLGSVITVGVDGAVALEQRPEVKKAGGVFYTPDYIVDHIVRRTLGPLVSGLTPSKISTLRIIDPSCGSGSFLLGAYQFLLDWHLSYYREMRKPPAGTIERGAHGEYRLSISERKRILVNSIFGVDIDEQAVEVAKLSLLLKVIEGELQLGLLVERLLPDLGDNIQCGNSLVGTDFHAPEELIQLTASEQQEVNSFDWDLAFPQVNSDGGFDAVVGNPPWLMAGYALQDFKDYLQRHYSVWVGKADLYYLFIEKSCRLVRPGGRIGLIVPSKMFHTKSAKTLRGLLADESWLESLVDFGTAKIFETATNYSTILQLQAGTRGGVQATKAGVRFAEAGVRKIPRDRFSSDPWLLMPPKRYQLWKRLSKDKSIARLDDITERFGTGAQTGKDPLLLLKPGSPALAAIEDEFLAPTLKGKSVRRYQLGDRVKMVFPYQVENGAFSLIDAGHQAPGLWSYLRQHEAVLRKRVWFKKSVEELAGAWYGLPYVDSHEFFAKPHILTPSLSDRSNFVLGDGSLFVTGTAGVTSIVPHEEMPESIYYLLGVLNSKLVERFVIDHSTPYQGGYFKFSRPYLVDVPVPRIQFDDSERKQIHDSIATLAEGLEKRYSEIATLNGAEYLAARRAVLAAEKRIDDFVIELCGLTEEEEEALSAT